MKLFQLPTYFLFFTLLSLSCKHSGTPIQPSFQELFHQYYFIPEVHQHQEIWHADSIAYMNHADSAYQIFTEIYNSDSLPAPIHHYCALRLNELYYQYGRYKYELPPDLQFDLIANSDSLILSMFYSAQQYIDHELFQKEKLLESILWTKRSFGRFHQLYTKTIKDAYFYDYIFRTDEDDSLENLEEILHEHEKLSFGSLDKFQIHDLLSVSKYVNVHNLEAYDHGLQMADQSLYDFQLNDGQKAMAKRRQVFPLRYIRDDIETIPALIEASRWIIAKEQPYLYQDFLTAICSRSLYSKEYKTYHEYFPILKQHSLDYNIDNGNLERLIATYSLFQKDLETALHHSKKAISKFNLNKAHDRVLMQNMLFITYELYLRLGQNDRALQALWDSYNYIVRNDRSDFTYQTLSNDSLVVNYSFYADIINQAATIYYDDYNKTNNALSLRKALQLSESAVKNLNKNYTTIDEGDLLFFFRSKNLSVSVGLKSCFDFYSVTQDENYIIQALNFMEQGKSQLLYLDTKKANLDNELINKYLELKREVISLSHKSRLSSINQTGLLNEYVKTQKEIKIQYPEYFHLNYVIDASFIALLQKRLKASETTVLNYHKVDDKYFLIVISPSDLHFFQLNISEDHLNEYLDNFLLNPKCVIDEYQERSFSIYENIIEVWDTIPDLTQQVVIVAENDLNRISFESIVKDTAINNKFSQLEYLFKTRSISYCPSLKFIDFKEYKPIPNNSIIGFSFSSVDDIKSNHLYENLPELPGALNEVSYLYKTHNAQTYYGVEADKSQFLQTLSTHKGILHIATHGKMNGTKYENYLLFKSKRARLDTLMGIDLIGSEATPHTVILSACESSKSNYQTVEGNYSLVRYFLSLGIDNIVSHSWPQDDTASSNFYKIYYKKLSARSPINETRQEFLNFSNNDELSHPYYWGGIINYKTSFESYNF